jgi:hypothetical protein
MSLDVFPSTAFSVRGDDSLQGSKPYYAPTTRGGWVASKGVWDGKVGKGGVGMFDF